MGRLIQIAGLFIAIAAITIYVTRRLPDGESPEVASGFPPPPAELVEPVVRADSPPPTEVTEVLDLLGRQQTGEALGRVLERMDREGETATRKALLGLIRLADRQADEAREALAEALEADPKCGLARMGQVRLSLATRNFPQAAERLAKLCREQPTHPEYWRLRAVAHLGLKRPGAALRFALRAVSLNHRSPILATTVADCLLRTGREADALRWYRAACGAGSASSGRGDPERKASLLAMLDLIEAR